MLVTSSVYVLLQIELFFVAIDYVKIGPKFSNGVLQTLLVLLRNPPTKDHRLLVIGTTSAKSQLAEFGLLESFQTVIEVPPITTKQQALKVAQEIGLVTEANDVQLLEKKLFPK